MSQDAFDVGDRPRTTWSVTLDGDTTDPPIVMLLIKSPAGESVSIYGEVDEDYPIFRDSEGVYHADIPLNAKGIWYRRWVAFDELGVPLDAFESQFKVLQSAFAEPLPAVP